MKKYFYSVLAASMLFACSQEDIVDVTKGEGQMKTFKVEIPKVESRTVGGIEIGKGTQADNLIYAMYENGKDEVLISGVVTDGEGEDNDGTFTVTVPMAKDLKYDLLFLAYNASNSAFNIASNPEDTDLKALQFKANQTANIDAFDAFVGALEAHGVADANDVTLKRPFAQINAATSAEDMKNATTLKLDVTKSSLLIKGVPASYNVLEGTASGSADVTYAAYAIPVCDEATTDPKNEQLSVDGTNYYYLTLAYVLAGEVTTTSTHNATFEFQREGGQSVSTLEIVSLPIQRNYRTNVIGDLLTKSEEYTIKIDANFGGKHVVGVWNGETEEAEEKEGVYEITNASQLAWIAEQVDGGETFKDKTVKLMNNIDLANVPWNPIGTTGDTDGFQGTFDGNGKTISNLYVDLTAEPAYQSAGLFANARYATIKNFTVNNAVVKNLIKSNNGDTSCGTAVVLGSAQYPVTIENVDVNNAVVEGNRYVGGIGGYVCGTIQNCDVNGISLTAKPDNLYNNTYDNGDKVGGILGYHNTISDGTNLTSNNTVNDFTIRAYRDMGGIAGAGRGNFTNNRATNGTITSDQVTIHYADKDANAQAIVGRTSDTKPTIDNDQNFENVTIITLTNDNYVTSQEAFTAALQTGGTIYLGKNSVSVEGRAATADYTWLSAAESFEIIAVEEGVVINMNNSGALCSQNISASFEGVTLNYNNVDYSGFHHSTSETYKNCHINGVVWTYAPKATFEGCTFNQTGDAYNIWMYGADTNEILVKDCEFTSYCKSILIYAESAKMYDVTIENSTFKSEKNDDKAAVQMHTQAGIYGTLTMNDVTVSGAYLQFPENGGLYNEVNKNTTPATPTNNFVKIINGKKTVGTAEALKNAISAAKDGDVIYLADGTYKGEFDLTHKKLTIEAEENAEVTIRGMVWADDCTVTLKGLTLTNPEGVQHPNPQNSQYYASVNNQYPVVGAYNKADITFEGCTFELTVPTVYGFYGYAHNSPKFKGCTFNCNEIRPIASNGPSMEVTGCTFNDQYHYSVRIFENEGAKQTVVYTNNIVTGSNDKSEFEGINISKKGNTATVLGDFTIKGNTEGLKFRHHKNVTMSADCTYDTDIENFAFEKE